jgi:hypothetical protein
MHRDGQFSKILKDPCIIYIICYICNQKINKLWILNYQNEQCVPSLKTNILIYEALN